MLFFSIVYFTIWMVVNVAQSKVNDTRLEAELQCLEKRPNDVCDLTVIYPVPVGSLDCDMLTDNRVAYALETLPQFSVSSELTGTKGLLLMFDPDAPVSKDPQDGFIHFIALVSVDGNGNVIVQRIITDYYPPSPPRGHGEHRYQYFLYDDTNGGQISPPSGRKFQLCPFLAKHKIGRQPVASFQFRHIRL
ncbi:phosphatidylethanolamine-binding protein 4 [Biomphalaria glabrata]|uniref:Phosphatidylethanolamine-binding protein 4-like n=1 Tax=Biomphalaria glabrata TaxID=6526 RepID=A0A9W2Z0S5_BIOGL|nr:phosphatidylethanolamine-binding protein 4-like [Biomphalaria glabrata]KAI8733653.1 phosphatidylethanolamine-binding protein 4-like [Biomphalaria glabrata]